MNDIIELPEQHKRRLGFDSVSPLLREITLSLRGTKQSTSSIDCHASLAMTEGKNYNVRAYSLQEVFFLILNKWKQFIDITCNMTPRPLSPIITLIIVLLFASLFKLLRNDTIEQKSIFVVSDTIGLVAFSVTGALLAIGADYNFFGVISLSFITAIGGSVIRDILINQVPTILISDFYGSIALIVSLLLYILHVNNALNSTSILIISVFAIALRLIAYYKEWHLPKIR